MGKRTQRSRPPLPDAFIIGMGTLGPIGSWGKAPGTNGSAAGLLWFLLLHFLFFPSVLYYVLLLLTIPASIWICTAVEQRLRKHDPRELILDEFIAVPFCFLGLETLAGGHMLLYLLPAGFILFRFFDILKPIGISRLQRLKGGMGVVMDDIAAALATCAVLHLGIRLF